LGDYLWLAVSMHLQVTSQGQPNLLNLASASEDTEVNRPITSQFDFRNFHI
jgi:hypothetical protein